ncbi:MAG: sel1 repeat family protein, partial [Bacteroidetes bacterium]|nr:sel1 repeat family protein [Bacteroidota bacterium]
MNKVLLFYFLLSIVLSQTLYPQNNKSSINKKQIKEQTDSVTVLISLADSLYNIKSYKEAISIYDKVIRIAPENTKAQFQLGYLYNNGRDYQKSFYWFEKAAEQGVAAAQYNLGIIYADGYGVLKDNKEAITWYKKAANQGYAKAQYDLGVLYSKGELVLKDYKEAITWYE